MRLSRLSAVNSKRIVCASVAFGILAMAHTAGAALTGDEIDGMLTNVTTTIFDADDVAVIDPGIEFSGVDPANQVTATANFDATGVDLLVSNNGFSVLNQYYTWTFEDVDWGGIGIIDSVVFARFIGAGPATMGSIGLELLGDTSFRVFFNNTNIVNGSIGARFTVTGIHPVPVPAALPMLLSGVAGMVFCRRKVGRQWRSQGR